MKAFIVVAGAAFGLLVLAHIARLFAEGTHLLSEPIFLLTTVGSMAACVWALFLLKKPPIR